MSCVEEKDLPLWPAPHAENPVIGAVSVPGSKSMTNRALILAALAAGPSTIVGALRSRDTDLMMDALRSLGARISDDGADIRVDPAPLRGGNIDCGLAGTVMRFVPPVAATAAGEVFFDGDAQARTRPMSTMLDALRSLGVQVDGDTLPFTVHGTGSVAGGVVRIDASASSQFISGLLLAGARFENGVTIVHEGASLPSVPHIDMSVDMVRSAGVSVHTDQPNTWVVEPGPIAGRTWRIEPDLSNTTPFLAAAAVTGGTVRVHDWPGLHGSVPPLDVAVPRDGALRDGALRDGALRDGAPTTQAGDAIRGILEHMGCRVELTAAGDSHDLVVTGPARGGLVGIDIDMSDIGELTPTVAALAALAATPSKLQGIAHLRGHETDRLAALSREINRLGGNCTELDDGLLITPAPLSGGVWHSYADHRMATAGAIIGLVVPGVQVENIATTSKTLPDFAGMWTTLVTTTVQHG